MAPAHGLWHSNGGADGKGEGGGFGGGDGGGDGGDGGVQQPVQSHWREGVVQRIPQSTFL